MDSHNFPRSENSTQLKPRIKTISWIILLSCILAAAAWRISTLMAYPDSGQEPEPSNLRFTHVARVSKAENPLSGVNLGVAVKGLNGGNRGIEMNQGDFDALQDAGFRYIRVPVQFLLYMEETDGGYRLKESMLERVDGILNNILGRGMTAILDFHYLIPEDVYSFRTRDEKQRNEEQFLAVWEILADRYREYPTTLYFELANEPRKPILPDDWNRYVSGALRIIRASGGNNRARNVVVANPILIGPLFRSWENVRGIDRLELPTVENDPHILVTFHYYDPVPFTYQGQTYNRDLKRYSRFWAGNCWANTERQQALVRRDFDRISRWAEKNRRQVMLGEFGVSIFADGESQIRWTELIREEAESRGMIWIFWQFFYEYAGDTLGGLYSHSGGFWRSEMINALQPRDLRRADPATSSVLTEEQRLELERKVAELTNPEWKVRRAAAQSLTDADVLIRGAVPALMKALTEDEEWQVRREAAQALYAHRPDPDEALPGLIAVLDDEEWQVRLAAVRAIGRMGSGTEDALPALFALLKDREWQVREAALLAMVFTAPGNLVVREAVRKALSDPEEHIRETAHTLIRHPALPEFAALETLPDVR